jgi:hypothetical protein
LQLAVDLLELHFEGKFSDEESSVGGAARTASILDRALEAPCIPDPERELFRQWRLQRTRLCVREGQIQEPGKVDVPLRSSARRKDGCAGGTPVAD